MTERNEVVGAEWLPNVEEFVAMYAAADEAQRHSVCKVIEGKHGAEAGAKARELFAARRVQAAAKPKPISPPTPISSRGWRRFGSYSPQAAELKKFWDRPQPQIEAEAIAPEPAPEAEPEVEPAPKPAERTALPAVVPPVQPPARADWDDALEAVNGRHAIIENYGGKTVIASWEPSTVDPSRNEVVFQSKESFLLRYSNRYVTTDLSDGRGGIRELSQPLGHWWLNHRQRRQHRGITFQPGGAPVINDCLNVWQGWGVEARPGDWSLIRAHIEEVLADGNAEFAEYIIRWIAWSIQNPAAQAEVALVLIGEKGAGKGTLVRCLERIFGAHTFQVTSRDEVIGKFNGHLQNCVLFVADEAYWGGDKRCVGRLQGLITEPKLPIERKGFDVIEVRNCLHVVMLAEPGWVIPAGRYERRYAAFAVSKARRGDREYFRELHRQIDQSGTEAMFGELQGMDLQGWHPRDIPEALLTNPALQKQQSHTLPPLEQWYVSLLHNGKLPGALPKRPNTAFTSSLLEDAREQVPRLQYLSDVELRNFLIDEERIGIVCEKYRAPTANGWAFPPLGECRQAWCDRWGPTKFDLPDAEDWSK